MDSLVEVFDDLLTSVKDKLNVKDLKLELHVNTTDDEENIIKRVCPPTLIEVNESYDYNVRRYIHNSIARCCNGYESEHPDRNYDENEVILKIIAGDEQHEFKDYELKYKSMKDLESNFTDFIMARGSVGRP